jgi:adenosine deaminase
MRSFAELHVHIEGTLEPKMAFALAKRNNVELPFADAGELRSRLQFQSIQEFWDLYEATTAVLQTEQDFTDLANAYFAKAKAAGVVRAEVSCDLPTHLARGLTAQTVLGGLSAALSRSEADFGISSGLILNFPQHAPIEQAEDAYGQAIASGAELVAVGVCLTQAGAAAAPFAGLFGRARSDGLHTVAHVGGEAGSEVVWDCLRSLRVGRIGSCDVDDRDLMYYLSDYSIPLTFCPLANAALHGDQQQENPLPRLLDEGVVVTISSDAPAYFGGYLDANVAAATQTYGLRDDQLDTLARNSIAGAFLPETAKVQLAGDLIPA